MAQAATTKLNGSSNRRLRKRRLTDPDQHRTDHQGERKWGSRVVARNSLGVAVQIWQR